MCGILGSVNSSFNDVNRITSIQKHRGPDDFGSYCNKSNQVILVHNRLSIIDTSSAGHQPLIYEHNTEKFIIVFNGEIYNYFELKEILLNAGYHFYTNTDTEVIAAAYSFWGSSCVLKFRGMFAFAIWDESSEKLFIARDRLGIKPFLYHKSNNHFFFASELRTLLSFKSFTTTINKSSLIDYLTFGSIRQPKTLVEEINWLPKGHFGILKDGHLHLEKYWDLYDITLKNRSTFTNLSYEDGKILLRAKIEEATKYHLISDVEIGAFLSGGIDSTAVVGLMKKYYPETIHTFTIGFSGLHNNVDESSLAEKTSQLFKTTHHKLLLTKEVFNCRIKEFFKSIDQPSIDGFNTFLISELASKHVKVVLSGLGGDELFYGYNHFREFEKYDSDNIYFANKFLYSFKGILDRLPGRIKRRLVLRYGNELEKILTVRRYLGLNKISGLMAGNYITEQDVVQYEKQLIEQLHDQIKGDLSLLQNLSLFEINNYLTNTLLRDTDIASMKFGLELRPILIDHELVELSFSLPDHFKRDKKIFVDCLSDLLPQHVVDNPKNGFELPYTQWLNEELYKKFKFFKPSIQNYNSSFIKHAFYLEKFLESNDLSF